MVNLKHSLKGKKQSPEHIAKRVAANRKSGAYDKASIRCKEWNKSLIGSKISEETKFKISKSMKGKQNSLGVKRSVEFRQKLSHYYKTNPEKHNHYIDGKGHERVTARLTHMGTLEYRLWREQVFERDNYTCQMCGERGGKLNADHIKPYNLFKELRTDINNGRTLCENCHRLTPTWGGRVNKISPPTLINI